MKFVDEYRNAGLISDLARKINREASGSYKFMEVCGGHTAAIHRFGIRSLLNSSIELLSGPGCPVCVTGTGFIDKLLFLSGSQKNIIATFGDLIRVPGSASSLERQRASGADVRMVFSPLDALQIAIREPERAVIFPAIGFETTAPGTAATVIEAAKLDVRNFYVLCAHKVMPPAMELLIKDGTSVNGFICPGHVATVTGSSVFDFIPARYGIGCVVTGFEPVDILQSVEMLVMQVNVNKPGVMIQYRRAVTEKGNEIAQRCMSEVFETCDAWWRGFGTVTKGGLKIRSVFSRFDAEQLVDINVAESIDNKKCLCSEILRGSKIPSQCRLFSAGCDPENPVGACMVSSEGACNTYYRYRYER